MNKNEILARLNMPQPAYLATLENGEPRVRGVQIYAVDERGLIFHTAETKAMYAQIKAHPKVELCVLDPETHAQYRVRGEFEETADLELKKEIFAHPSRPYLKPWMETMGEDAFYSFLRVFKLKNATAQVWTMATNASPLQPVELF